ncbi:MAG: hypothetical protein ACRDRO_01570 [Pseudonocardiaceae bacterium]
MSGLRRGLQLTLGVIWLLDAALQYQPYMFSRAFATQTLAPTAQGNPVPIAASITWSAGLIADHPVVTNAVFATVQLLLALGLFWRRTVTSALAASVVWSVAVWWFGEGFGGVLTGGANPLTGAPGAAILYALAAVLLWPGPRDQPEPAPGPRSVAAASPLGDTVARLLWLVLWGSLAYLALQPATRAANGPHDAITGLASGEPGWLASLDYTLASSLANTGQIFAVVSAVVLAIIAVGVFTPPPLARATLILAILVATAYWVIGENFGGLFTGQGTDPNSGPLLILLAATYWPYRTRTRRQPEGTPALAGAHPGSSSPQASGT